MARKTVIWEDQAGRNVARDRYGEPRQGMPPATGTPRPQDPESRRSGTGNTRQGYLTGATPATGRPGFDAWADRKGRK